MTATELDHRAIDVIRALAMDAPQAANSGHPGTAMALAPLAHVLWTRIMRHDPEAPDWPDRDRFILSAGHASILLYSMLHLNGYGLTLDDLKAFRQWGSATPGHPERGHTTGVEVTTGPLGQGFANGVGMAIAEQALRTRFGPDLFDHHIFAICSDGDLQEGVSHEAASLAGHLGLGRLVYVYDDNAITIDGSTELSMGDDSAARFRAYGWHVEDLGESAEDLERLEASLRSAMSVTDQPSLLILRSHIGYPSPNMVDTAEAHGSPFGAEEITRTKQIMGVPDEPFWVPDEVLEWYRDTASRCRQERRDWERRLEQYDGDRAELEACLAGSGLAGWDAKLPSWSPGESVATRKASGSCLNAVLDVVPGLVGGGADLTGNTGTELKGHEPLSRHNRNARQIHFGIREHAMGGVMNGMALHGGALPFGGTFLVFSDYMRPAVRLAALSGAHVIYSWTHDSVGLGEDGPTHQPVEHLAALRAIPGLTVIRPADANETAAAWKIAVQADGPVALILTRQDVPVLEGTGDGLAKGAYVLVDTNRHPDLVLVGTGSEVQLCIEAAQRLGDDHAVRVVSMPSWELFEAADQSYRSSVLPPDVPALAVEAGTGFGWDRWVDASVSIERFGASAPGNVALEKFGFNPDNVVAAARDLLGQA